MQRELSLSAIYFVLILLFSVSIYAGELATGGSGKSNTDINKKEYEPRDGQCPHILQKWVQDDIDDSHAWGFIKFKSEFKTCEGAIKTYRQYLVERKESAQFHNPNHLGQHLNQKYKNRIHPSYQEKFLNDCSKIPQHESAAVQTRFYAASARIEATNSAILDEVSYFDSVLPKSTSVLDGVECTQVFPENNKKCLDYKMQARSCAQDKQKRFDYLVKKTKQNLMLIQDLEIAHEKCMNKMQANEKSSCDNFLRVIELKKNETPWVRGEIFEKRAIKKKGLFRGKGSATEFITNYDFNDGNIEKAVEEQMTANRKSLSDNYKNNLVNFRCLTNSTLDNGEKCDFNKIRTDLSALPNLVRDDFNYTNPKDFEARTYVDAESCLLQSGKRREEHVSEIDKAGRDAAIGLLTLGVGSVATGVKVVNAASKVSRNLTILTVAGGLTGSIITADLHKECSKETKLVSDLSNNKSNVTKENICFDPMSTLSQAREEENNCVVGALLSGTNLLPFMGSVPSLARLAKLGAVSRSKKSIENFPDDAQIVKNSKALEKALTAGDEAKAAAMIKKSMVEAGHDLTDAQVKVIIKAHEDVPCKIGGCSPEELAKKIKIMKLGGIDDPKIRRAAIERGWAGNPDDKEVMFKSIDLVDGNQPKLHGNVVKYEPTAEVKTYIAKGYGASLNQSNDRELKSMVQSFQSAGKAENDVESLVNKTYVPGQISGSKTAQIRILGGDHERYAENLTDAILS